MKMPRKEDEGFDHVVSLRMILIVNVSKPISGFTVWDINPNYDQ